MSVLVDGARAFALKHHGDQRYGEFPYEKHLVDVTQVLRRYAPDYHFPDEVIAAGWLHDVVEDTPVKAGHIYKEFGPAVGDLVHAVTNENGRNRKEKTVKTMLKIRERGDEHALAVKLADRIANSAFSKANQSPQFKMYRVEYPFIRWFLKDDRLSNIWRELDDLLL